MIQSSDESQLKQQFESFILEQDHPCVMAKSVFSDEQVDFHTYQGFGTKTSVNQMITDLNKYLDEYDFNNPNFYTFIAAFPDTGPLNEKEFEEGMWKQLQYLHEADQQPWDPSVSKDPHASSFSFSLGGHAFYIVGLHPYSSRLARKSPCPALVFNLHLQFEMLREMGSYEMIRNKIRERDIDLQGSVNPMLKDFGEESEARQYSGRKLDEGWKCPFHPRQK